MIERRKAKENAVFLWRVKEQQPITERGEEEQESELLEQGEPHPPLDSQTVPGLEPTQETTLDELVPRGSLPERLHELNTIMANISPERVRAMVSQTIRRDTKLVKALKEFYQFHCQFPCCNVRIPKRGGEFYIEVAHVEPVHRGGRSILGNLLVLCPNHHKELDYGDLEIREQTEDKICGVLNGREFEIQQPRYVSADSKSLTGDEELTKMPFSLERREDNDR